MNVFREILRQGLQQKCLAVYLIDGEQARFVLRPGQEEFGQQLHKGWLNTILQPLFAQDPTALTSEKPLTGSINIPNIGTVKLLVHGALPRKLNLYLPPQSEELFQRDWQALNATIPTPPKHIQTKGTPLEGDVLPSEAFSATGYAPSDNDDMSASPIPAQEALHVPAPDLRVAPPTVSPAPVAEENEGIFFGVPVIAHIEHKAAPIDSILMDMIEMRASDLHLVNGQPPILRIDGEIQRQTSRTPLTPQDLEQLILPIMPDNNRREFAKTSDTDFAYEIPDVGRFRVNVFRNYYGVAAVLRHIPSTVLTAEQLNLPKAIMRFCTLNKGLVLVTGPTGSGKSTTLAAMIDTINKTRTDHLLTVEDPIEFVHKQHRCLINQREVGRHTKSFARALKAALREDPDIVLIGEMRDLETIHIALETAETGHLVFGTLHTNSAVSTLDRIIDQFPADQQGQIRMMLSSSLRGVVSQTLLKKKGGGRVAAHDILVPNDAVASMIRESKNHMIANHMQTQRSDGNQLLADALLNLVIQGVVDPMEAWAKAVDKKGFEEMARRKGFTVGQAPETAAVKKPA